MRVPRSRGRARKNACRVCLRYLQYFVSPIRYSREFQIFFRALPRLRGTRMGWVSFYGGDLLLRGREFGRGSRNWSG
jgi:hypothetical protein